MSTYFFSFGYFAAVWPENTFGKVEHINSSFKFGNSDRIVNLLICQHEHNVHVLSYTYHTLLYISSIIFMFHVLSLRTMKTQSRGVPWGTSRHPQMCLKTFSIHGEDFHYFHMARISYIFNVHAEYLPFCRENFLKLKKSLVHTRAPPDTYIFVTHTFILLHFTLCLT